MNLQINILLFFGSFALVVNAKEICNSAICKTLSDNLLHKSMNTKVQPCDDFYEYICGNFPKYNPIDPKYEMSGSFISRQLLVIDEINEAFKNALNSSSKAVKYVAEMYNECLDTDTWEKRGTAPLVDFIETIVGAWPMIGRKSSNHDQKKKTWQEIFVDMYSKAGHSYIFDIRDMLGKLRIQPGKVVMNPLKNRYQPSSVSNASEIAHYREFLLNLIQDFGVSNASIDHKMLQNIEQLIHFESNLEKAYQNEPSHGDYFDGTLGQFQEGATHGKVQWLNMLKQIQVNFAKQTNNTFKPPTYSENTKMEGLHMHYINEVIAILDLTPIEVVQNFFATAIALNYGFLTKNKVRETLFQFTDEKELLNVRSACSQVSFRWPLIMGRVYVDTHFTKPEKMAATTLVNELKASFKDNLEKRNQWLDAATREYAIKKLDAITAEVGYPEWILDNEKVDDFYPYLKTADLQKGKFLEKIIWLNVQSRQEELEVSPPVDKNKTHITISPFAVNAFYNVLENSIMIPAGILQQPFFDHKLSISMNYGAIGAILGHELTHSMDSRGKNYDLHGKLKNWWTPATEKAFDEKAHCLAQQYNDIVEEQTKEHLHGGQTLGENIADNGGVKEAFGAYQAHQKKINDSMVLPGLKFTPNQLFFVSYANIWCQAITIKKQKQNMLLDAHSPNKYRVNVVLGNFDQFAKAFNCPVGSKMNPVHKCSVW